MILSTFDLYGKKETENHGLNLYYDVFFDWKKIEYKNKISEQLNIYNLTTKLNNSDFRVCHNFNWYDWNKLPWLKSHSEQNIDTLLIDTLLNFDKPHHNLKKSQNNNPLEDAESTFKVLENNLITFHNLSLDVKNVIYSLLINYNEYNDFFIFYNKLTLNKLENLDRNKIIKNINNLLIKKWILENSFDFNVFFKSNNEKLALSYLVLFLEKQKIVIPDFIYPKIKDNKNNNWNVELIKILRENLNIFYKIFENYFNNNIKEYLKDFYNFKDFRWETQSLGVKYGLENKDILTILSTGGWKSLIYQLPARIIWEKLWHLSLVITPLKALIKDQIDWLNKKWFNEVKYFSGDQNNLEKEIIRNKIKSGETKILFLTPESLRNENNLDLFKNRYISRIIIDEAHTLILWWAEFRPDYFFIKIFLDDLQKINLNKKINITLLTATAPIDVENWLKNYFWNRILNIIKQENILKENIKASVINIKNPKNKVEILINKIKEVNNIKNGNIENPTIIFTGRRKISEELVKHLEEEWIKSSFFHAWMFLNQKKEIQNKFISWELNLIIATKAFWMWIDKKNVRYVIHYDLPWNIEDYLQEIWRAWRDWMLSKNIIFYDKKNIEKRIKQLNVTNINNYNFLFFLQNILVNKKNYSKIVLSPREIANFSWIKTNKKNYITDIKILLNFLEREKIFKWSNLLERKYDNTLVLFNKIEKFELNKNYKIIEEDNFLNNDEKELAKNIINKIIEEKKAVDLNILENNFEEFLWEDFNYKNTLINKIINKIKTLKILWKKNDNEEVDLVIEAGSILKDEKFIWEEWNKYWKLFNIYKKRIKNIKNFEEKNNSSFYEKIKNYYLFKNFISDKSGKISIKNKNLIPHFDRNVEISKIILDNIFDDKNELNNEILNIVDLLKKIQNFEKYNNFWISELKEVLYFLHFLDIIKLKNGLLVLLTRFNLTFNQNIFELKEKLKNNEFKEKFNLEIKEKLNTHIEMKKQKLLALQLIVNNLEKSWIKEYNLLARYYFNHSLKEFSEKYLIKKDESEYEKELMR